MKNDLLKFNKNININDDKEDLPDIEIEEVEIKFNTELSEDIYEDYKYSRIKLVNMIQKAEGVLNHALIDMKNNPGPRPIEAFSSLLKVLNETHEKIFNLHEKMKKFQKEDKKENPIEDEDKPKTIKANVNDIIDAMNRED